MSDPQSQPPTGDEPKDWTPAPPGGWIEIPEAEQSFDPLSPPPQNPWGQAPPNAGYGYGQPAYRSWTGAPLVNKPKSNLGVAIAATVLCCLPLGIVAIVYAAQVDSKWNAGDWQGAERASRAAKNWALASFVGGLLFTVIYVMIVVGSATSTTGAGY